MIRMKRLLCHFLSLLASGGLRISISERWIQTLVVDSIEDKRCI